MTYSMLQAEAASLHKERKVQAAIVNDEIVCWRCLGKVVLDGWLREYQEDPIEHMHNLVLLTPAQLTGKDRCVVCGKVQVLSLVR